MKRRESCREDRQAIVAGTGDWDNTNRRRGNRAWPLLFFYYFFYYFNFFWQFAFSGLNVYQSIHSHNLRLVQKMLAWLATSKFLIARHMRFMVEVAIQTESTVCHNSRLSTFGQELPVRVTIQFKWLRRTNSQSNGRFSARKWRSSLRRSGK